MDKEKIFANHISKALYPEYIKSSKNSTIKNNPIIKWAKDMRTDVSSKWRYR